ncbi:helix-turn-helix domain-containing protein [Paenibacillus glycanilyticus]|uniref:AraC family transcriptional regulator n=1 Tax=Paenibacillus glycanilyticus TaxID=126569 RepID=UPI00203BB519|nr:helix-turn-helix domain-containing protein [Paenibacillus glycanilyticus]MCM3626732.1 helix-turn-helix domain-containing protein [Paenibacillus glycanilyticus]
MKQMLVTALDRTLPIYIELLGWNEWQDEFIRPHGYHCYHWLQTTGGEGQFECEGKTIILGPNQGILLPPNVPHRYKTTSYPWSTWYITFNGNMASILVSSLGLATCTAISWESHSRLSTLHKRSRNLARSHFEFNGIDGSAFVYRFLMELKRSGQVDNQRSFSQHTARVIPLIRYLEENYSDPSLGLDQLADYTGVSPQRLNYLFRMATGMSPYQYLIHLRIQKAKELLINEKNLTVKAVALRVGFLDASHFVSTFRKNEFITPQSYRDLN